MGTRQGKEVRKPAGVSAKEGKNTKKDRAEGCVTNLAANGMK